MIALAYNELDYLHDLESHVENSQRTKSIISKILSLVEKNSEKYEFFVAKKLEYTKEVWDIVNKVHSIEYLDYLKKRINKTKKIDFIDPDTYITSESLNVVLTNLELLFGLASWVVKNNSYGFAYVRPPGHHAESNKAMGFCLINNVAVLARYLQFYHNIKKIMIVDFDAHHGNGTQEIFYEDDSVVYFSTHAYPFYPFTGLKEEIGRSKGIGYNFNFPLSIYAGDEELKQVYEENFREVYEKIEPEFLLVSAGYDIHSHDPITYMTASIDGINTIKKILMKSTEYKNVIFILEGGYNTNVLEEVVYYDINGIK
ncbi:MAG: histone deacetylase [bacterium]